MKEKALPSSLPVELLTIQTKHDPAEVHPCMLCGGPTKQILLSHERWTSYKAIRADAMPAYRCDDCGVESFKLDGVIEFLTEAIKHIKPKRDPTRVVLRQELAAALRAKVPVATNSLQ